MICETLRCLSAPSAQHNAPWRPLTCHFSPSVSPSLSSNVGQSLCIDIFSVYRSPESRIGDHPRNRLSHFYILQKWSGQDLSSIFAAFDWVCSRPPHLERLQRENTPTRGGPRHRHMNDATLTIGLGGTLWRSITRNQPFASVRGCNVTKCDFKI